MALNFPNKKVRNQSNLPVTKQIKQKASSKDTNLAKANLGMDLEGLINESNEYYLNNDYAVIHKKPTPVQIVKVEYPMRSKAVITEAYYKTPSTTDYNGIYKGKYIDFEAKENHNKTAFPLSNIHPHQMTHLESIIKHGGIGFLIVSWSYYNEYYLLPFEVANEYWVNAKLKDERKSIPYSVFKERAYLIKEGYLPRLNYLKTVDEVFFK
ncbi:recombination protein U [Anaeroplasma bactoclasticum]|jgi:recombination protein U|uniref:Holliday junction resolvase RecU n=1 Tax=Anaeroplasma bactoclasticum TaxID=2088 RepID=A0A397RP57_9MOLU|nr:Holliday junction resolvase RecU [Anaeroplasma bactoclasticum]RIA73965.1 recombination protein U [Anaeroplasma bactoclasticum]